MIDINAYSLHDLQTLSALLTQSERAGIVLVADLMALVMSRLELPAETNNVLVGDCPSCGKGLLIFWPASSRQAGSRVVGCTLCHYSRIEEV